MVSTIDGALKFYYQPTNGELTTIFQRVALDLTMVRLVDDSTPVARRVFRLLLLRAPLRGAQLRLTLSSTHEKTLKVIATSADSGQGNEVTRTDY